MSGGSMEYLSSRIEEYAEMFEDKEIVELVKDVAQLWHDCEWYHSGDTCKGEYLEAVENFKNKWFEGSREELLKTFIDNKLEEVKEDCYRFIGGINYCYQCKSFEQLEDSKYGDCEYCDGYLTHRHEKACAKFEKEDTNEPV